MKHLLFSWILATLVQAAPVALFDGKSLAGWETRKGEEKWWRVEDGMITGGSLTEKLPFNTFLTSSRSYENFELTFKIRLIKGEGFSNSGMQVRSERVPNSSEMKGYQVDAGVGYWGDLYDESRRNKAIAKSPAPMAKDWEWNDYRIRCEGPRIRSWINGVAALDYVEKDPSIPLHGKLGLQAHSGGTFLVQIKDVFIDELPSADGSLKSPDAQRRMFSLPDGFHVELVSSEEQGVEKPITVTWDRHGRMWTMTATEYPVDANENEEIARDLFKRGGKDRVMVFDNPNGPLPLTPQVFADGLAIPLGLLPLPDGVLVQHGPQVRLYQDNDKDGKADAYRPVLDGFGIQDSHLFPHQFERAPGGWVYLAQGAFNFSNVRRPDGLKFDRGEEVVPFNHCKLARFRPDGASFEPLTAGPNNIWGLVINRRGETFVQEANDMGYPVAEFAPGTHYRTSFGPKLREDAPLLPPSTQGSLMGGTGLSGLALAEDQGSPFHLGREEGSVFYVVNPITSRIQTVHLAREKDGHYIYQKGEDFLLSKDPNFRPIAAHFGPDGFLYVVDWYNKIISHNEVPRTHPDRDKTRGRIWRIRHESQKAAARVDLATSTDEELIDYLGGANARISSQAWQEIIDRKATGLTERLSSTVRDSSADIDRRVAALWALEGLGAPPVELLEELAASPHPELRHEAVRIAGELSLAEPDFLTVASKVESDAHFRVRAALANAVRAHRQPTARILAVAARLGRPPLSGNTRDVYDRNFGRYLARWAMSSHPAATAEMLETIELPVEAELLAARSFPDPEAAMRMTPLLDKVARPLTADEIALLGRQISEPTVLRELERLLSDPAGREALLRTMTQLDPKVATVPALQGIVAGAARRMLEENRTDQRLALSVRLARLFRLRELAGDVEDWLRHPDRTEAELIQGLGTLREMGGLPLDKFRPFLDHPADPVRREAISGFGSVDDADVVSEFKTRWSKLDGSLRALAVTAMTSSRMKAEAFAKALAVGDFESSEDAIEKLIAALGLDHPTVTEVLKSQEGLLRPILRFNGSGRVKTAISLKGPFTVETWIKLDPEISERDNLLGKKQGQDFNFYQSKLRVFGGKGVGDVIVASRAAKASEWMHCAITRDAAGRFTLYLDGEADSAVGMPFANDFLELYPGEGFKGMATSASMDELRVWDVARSADEIRRNLHTRMDGTKPPGLRLRLPGNDAALATEGAAGISIVRDFPALVTPAQTEALEERFARYRKMAEAPGDPVRGRQLVQGTCMICHEIKGEGVAIGPNLSGAGAMGVEALLRNILTPSAQLESGYYRHDVKLADGSLVSGFLAGEASETLTLRQIGADERVIPRSQILSHEVSKRSLMPEGLIDGYTDQQVADLFSYLQTLR